MLKEILLCGTLLVSDTINISCGLATERAMPAQIIQNITTNTQTAAIAVISSISAVPVSLDARRPSQDLMRKIVDWLSATFGLPPIYDYPRIELASNARLASIRSQQPHTGNATETSIPNSAAAVTQPQNIVALYEDSTKTIYLSDGWTGAGPADTSVLVHEMVHHLQNAGGLFFECPPAREKLAYQAQEQWLRRFGHDLESTFGVDRLTILVRSACSL